jgi:hypothetical protein
MLQYPGFMITPIWFHACSNMDNLGFVFNIFSDASVVLTILFYLVIIHLCFTLRCIWSNGFLEAFYRDQGEFSDSHLDAEGDSYETCLRLGLHGWQRKIERSVDDINRRGEREVRMRNAIERGQSELVLLMTRRTRRIGRSRKAHISSRK